MDPSPRPPDPPAARRILWWVAAFVAGAVIMGLELTAVRLFAPYFGYSLYVWGSLMAVIMVVLAVGYAVGGRVADRAASDRPLFAALLISAAAQAAVIAGAHAILPPLALRGEILGPALATALLLAPSMGPLAVAGPFVIRLLARVDRVGTSAGRVYALGTLGGVTGILATSFWSVPSFGTRATLLGLLGATAACGALGLVRRHPLALAALVLPALAALGPGRSEPEGLVWADESPYNLIRVVRRVGATGLLLDAEASLHSLRRADGWSGRYWDDFTLGPLLAEHPRRALVLGLGAGASLEPMWSAAPELHIDGVELDPGVLAAAERWFGLEPSDPRLTVHVADARPWLARHAGPWDVIQIDVYQGGPYVPFYLTTVEFYGIVADRLAPGGVLMLNVFDLGAPPELLHAVGATLREVFPSVWTLSRPGGNHTVLAFPSERTRLDIRRDLGDTQSVLEVQTMARRAARALQPLRVPEGTPVFTDDHAPVEEMTRRMFLARGDR